MNSPAQKSVNQKVRAGGPVQDSLAPPTPVECLLISILAAIHENTAAVRELSRGAHTQSKALSRADALLPVLAASVGDRAFCAREVMERAALLDVELRAALDAAGLVNARQLGKGLRSIEGRVIAGLRLERIGLDRDGILWRVWRVSHSHTHPNDCGEVCRGA